MSQLKNQLLKLIPRFSNEANKIKDQEARSRWMRLRKITESPKTLASACRFYGMSEDAYYKWGRRLLKQPRKESLFSKSKKPHRSPLRTKPKIEKKVLKLRRVEPSYGPERIANDMLDLYNIEVHPSTVYSILRRAKVVGQKIAERLTKKHLKRYRRPLPGYLQMDFKYVPYKTEGRQYYQLSCVDHHSSWRMMRAYKTKDMTSVMTFLRELYELIPFPIMEIQTDNDAAFTDKFTSQRGITGEHPMDQWCRKNDINHRLIPVGQKELNGKVENTHKQDDREFYAKGPYKSFDNLALNMKGYNDRWNEQRKTKALGFKTPNVVIQEAYVKAIAFLAFNQTNANKANYIITKYGDAIMPINETRHKPKKKNKTRKLTFVDRYLQYLEWEDAQKLKIIALTPTMSQNFSLDSLLYFMK